MAFKKDLLLLECIPKEDKMEEGIVIREFLKLAFPKKVKFKRIKTKDDFFKAIKRNTCKYIHISCHGYGDVDGYYIKLPKGKVYPSELDRSSNLYDRHCFISGCSLGKKAFADNFMKATDSEDVIAPLKDVYFIDAAAFWINFYYNLFFLGKGVDKSFDISKQQIEKSGAMQLWGWQK